MKHVPNLLALLIGAGLLLGGPIAAVSAERSVEVLSKTYTIDRKYMSMKGPQSTQKIYLVESTPPELLWVRGYRAVVVGPADTKPISQEFMCHSNLDYHDIERHNRLFAKNESSRIFTLSQGESEIEFPEGFGVPMMSDEPFALTTQVLNHNIENDTIYVRYKIKIEFVRDRDLTKPLRPLFTRGAYGLAFISGANAYFGVENPDEKKHGSGCLPCDNASTHVYEDALKKKFTGHWVVPPGRQTNRTLVTRIMDIPFNTSLHFAAVHLHPFAEILELRDLTTGKTVFKSRARGVRGKVGLSKVDNYSNAKGLPLYKDHEYELVSLYNNTSGKDQDAMAVMYLYLEDKNFVRPAAAPNP